MRSLLAKRGPLLGVVAGATVLLTASAAFACTQFGGTITISGTNASGSATYQGNGLDNLDGYCAAPSRLALQNSEPTLTFDLSVAAAGCAPALAGGDSEVPATTYEVRWIKATEAVELNTANTPNCHVDKVQLDANNQKVAGWVRLGDITVSSSGTTTKGFSLPPTGAEGVLAIGTDFRGPGNICLELKGQETFPVIFMKWAI